MCLHLFIDFYIYHLSINDSNKLKNKGYVKYMQFFKGYERHESLRITDLDDWFLNNQCTAGYLHLLSNQRSYKLKQDTALKLLQINAKLFLKKKKR